MCVPKLHIPISVNWQLFIKSKSEITVNNMKHTAQTKKNNVCLKYNF